MSSAGTNARTLIPHDGYPNVPIPGVVDDATLGAAFGECSVTSIAAPRCRSGGRLHLQISPEPAIRTAAPASAESLGHPRRPELACDELVRTLALVRTDRASISRDAS